MAYEQRSYAGGAVETTLAAGISATDLTITLDDATGWPSGGAAGPFFVVVDKGLAGEEKIEVQSRTGTTLTVASTGKRGVDGTTAAVHAIGAAIAHVFFAQDAQEANSHIANTALDHHTQYLNTARHDVTARHAFGAALGTPSTPAALTPDIAGAAGSGTVPARSDHVHNVPAATAVTSGLANAEGDSSSFARANHTHDQAAGSVDTAELVDDAVTTDKLDTGAVTSDILGADAVIAGKIADGAIADPAEIVDGIILLAKIASEAPTDYPDVTFTNPVGNYVQGTGGAKTAGYFKVGRICIMLAHFTLGTSGNINAGGDIEVSLPHANNATYRGFAAARARVSGGASNNQTWSGTGVIAAGASVASNFATAGTTANWGATAPFNWDDADSFDAVCVWFAAS